MPAATPKSKDETLRARDAQTVIATGVDVGPADDARLDQEAATKQVGGRSYGWGLPVIVIGILVIGALAIYIA